MQAYQIIQGGNRAAAAGAQSAALGQAHHAPAAGSVTSTDVLTELANRGYQVQLPHAPVHVAPTAPALTKSMAISVAIDEGLTRMNLPRTSVHPYRCPTTRCMIQKSQWDALVAWCVTVSNGYLAGRYGLPSWAASALHAGTLRGTALSGIGVSGLGDLSDWIQNNSWLVKSVGDTIANLGDHLTALQIQKAIKANTDKAFSRDDAMQLLAALQQQGAIPPGKAADVAQGANMATSSPYMMPLMIGAAILVVVMLMKR